MTNPERGLASKFRATAGHMIQAGKRLRQQAALHSPLKPLVLARLRRATPLRLNVGCGPVKFPGWVNIDIEPGADLVWDLRKGLPFEDGTVELVYNEHFIEHIAYEDGARFLAEVFRCLKPGGVVRLATPDLDHLIDRYNKEWRAQDWLQWPEYGFIETRGMMLNVAMRWWGHQFLYTEEDLRSQLTTVGFRTIRRVPRGESAVPDLAGRETRPDSILVLEAQR